LGTGLAVRGGAGCYVVYSASGDLLYIGKARRIATRLDYWIDHDEAGQCGVHHADHGWSSPPRDVQTIPVNEPYERLSLEEFLIQRLHPSDNTRGCAASAAMTGSHAMEAAQ